MQSVRPAAINGFASHGDGLLAALADPERFRAAYLALRLGVLTRPLSDAELATAAHVAAVTRQSLALDDEVAVQQGRRAVFAERERLLHEMLAIELRPERLHDLLDAIEVCGLEHVHMASGGMLLLSLHYGLYSSLLCLWLARAAAHGRLPRLTILLDSGPSGSLGLPERRVAELEAAGVGHRDSTELLDLRQGATALRRVVKALRRGEMVLMLPDAALIPADDPAGMPLALGAARIGVSRGPVRLVETMGCTVRSVVLRGGGNGRRLLFGASHDPVREPAAAAVQSCLQDLVDTAVLADPAPWAGWRQLCATVQ